MERLIDRMMTMLGVHESHQSKLRTKLYVIGILTAVMAMVYLAPSLFNLHGLRDYLPMHTALEGFAVTVAALIFAVGWNAYSAKLPGNVVFLSVLFLGVGLLDFAHLLSYKGMPDFITPNGVEKGIYFWLAGRFLVTGGLLTFLFLSMRPLHTPAIRFVLLGVVVVIVGLVHWAVLGHIDALPKVFVDGEGLTAFKVYSEYVIIVANLTMAYVLWRRMHTSLPYHAPALFAAALLTAMSEIFFTLYTNATDMYNLLGHLYKSVAYIYIYRAVFVTTVRYPYEELDASQQELKSKNRLLHSIVEHLPHMLFLKDAKELRFMLFNKAGEALIGHTKEEMIGRNDYDFFPEAQAKFFVEKDRETLRNKRPVEIFSEPIETPHGTRMLHTTKVPIVDEEGRPQYLLGISEDITERLAAEDALRLSERMLSESQKIAKMGSYVLDLVTMEWNSSAGLRGLFGIDDSYAHTIDGWLAIVHPEDRAMMHDYFLNEVIGEGVLFDKEYRIIRQSDKNVRWVHGQGRLEYDEPGSHPVKMIGTIQDVTERKKTTEMLDKLFMAVEQNPSSIVITDLEGKIEYVNEMFTKVTGYGKDEIIGQNPRLLKSNLTPQASYETMWELLVRGERWSGELINRRKDGTVYVEQAIINPVRSADGKIINYVAIKQDITEQKRAQEHMDHLAHFDQLTGLPNRVLLNDRVRYLLTHAKRNDEKIAVMFLDLDHFKEINDTLGHSVGDAILIETGKRLKSVIREEDTVSRLGGDEFILLFADTDTDEAMRIAIKLIETVSTPHAIEQYTLTVTPSIGIAMFPHDGETFETLLKNADTAMYRVKHDSRNSYQFFTSDMQAYSARKLKLLNDLRNALNNDELHLLYQPQLNIREGHVVGAEALLRWNHAELGTIAPSEFIPLAEESGQIIVIGEWVLRTAVAQMKIWKEAGYSDMIMAVNLSAIQFRQPDFVERVLAILDDAGLPPENLELELTEAIAMHEPKTAIAIMERLHRHGIRMSIDDFGTGYSSLSYLKQFSVYKLKIDQSFICDIAVDNDDRAIVSTVIDMAKNMGMKTIAEGVESTEQLSFLRLHGCDEVQGYYFSEPLTAALFGLYMKNHHAFDA